MTIELVWFKRDLRVHDHQALVDASNSEKDVVCIFLVEPERLAQPDCDPIHVEWELDCARALERELKVLGGSLDIRHEDALTALEAIHSGHGISTVRSHEEIGTEWSFERDKRVKTWCSENGVEWVEYPTNGVIRGLTDRDKWKYSRDRRMRLELLEPPEELNGPVLGTEVPTLESLGIVSRGLVHRPEPGQSAAWETLKSFLDERGEPYRWSMSGPSQAIVHCSRLSPYLSVGCISMRRVVQETSARMRELRELRSGGEEIGGWLKSLSSFQSRLAWHCHFMQKLENEPTLDNVAQNPLIDRNLARELDGERFAAWAEGRTGWPFFDACMRSLIATGWINFRMRAMLMSAASYNLWLPWRDVGLHLARMFLDYEPGIHWSQVGMQSGTTGINSVRAYSVTKQGRDHDAEGDFIRSWVPELSEVPKEHIHEPWKMPEPLQEKLGCVIGSDYPFPIVDEASTRKEGVRMTYAARRGEGTREVSKRVYEKHGSRRRPSRRRKAEKPDSKQTKLF